MLLRRMPQIKIFLNTGRGICAVPSGKAIIG
jgi:hypothetical protein